jgi:hypothetical protein
LIAERIATMGLDTSHDCWHGAYSAFMRWREEIAKLAGYPPLRLMEGFWSRSEPGALSLVEAACKGAYGDTKYVDRVVAGLPISWDYFSRDPLTVLLNHSDCEGEIEHKDLKPLADRLRELLEKMPSEQDFGGHIGNVREKTQQFIDGLMLAHEAGEDVEFH